MFSALLSALVAMFSFVWILPFAILVQAANLIIVITEYLFQKSR